MTTTHPPADRFRVGDVWRSPRGKDWTVDKEGIGQVRLRSVSNPSRTKWRIAFNTGNDILNPWQRITPPQN